MKSILTKSALETQELASSWVKSLKGGDLVLLQGDLGAGKTTFVEGLVKGLKIKNASVHSPTFSLIHEYVGPLSLVHVDLYRLNSIEELQELALEEYWQKQAICVVEWAERFPAYWPSSAYWIQFKKKDKNHREIIIQNNYDSRSKE